MDGYFFDFEFKSTENNKVNSFSLTFFSLKTFSNYNVCVNSSL